MLDAVAGAQMSYVVEFCVEGKLDFTALQAAMQRVAARHPMLQSNVEFGEGFLGCKWVPSTNTDPQIIQISTPIAGEQVSRLLHFNLEHEIGLRLLVESSGDRHSLRFVFHHACCDGIGAFQFLEEFLNAYHALVTGNSKSQLPELDTNAILNREPGPSKELSLWRKTYRSGFVLPKRVIRMMFLRPTSLADRMTTNDQGSERSFSLPVAILDRETTLGLRRKAAGLNTSLNTLCLRDLKRTLHKQLDARSSGPVRVMLPVSLRTREHRSMPAANCVSMVAMDSQPHECQDSEHLLTLLKRRTQYIADWQIEHSWNQTIRFLASMPGLKGLLNQRHRPVQATAVFSSLGRILRRSRFPKRGGRPCFGGLELKGINSAPPTSPNLPFAFFSSEYQGELKLNVEHDASSVSRDRAEAILLQWAEHLRMSASASQ